MTKDPLRPVELRPFVLRARDAEDLVTKNAAFERLVIRLQDFAVGSGYVYLRDVGLAEDAAQESFVIAWRHLHKLKDPNLFLAWLKRIIASQCHRVLRKKSTRLSQIAGETAHNAEPLEEMLARKECDKRLQEALEQLPSAERTAIILFYFAGRSHAAIASFLGIPRTTVVKRLFAARRRLKVALAPFCVAIQGFRPSRNQAFAAMVRAGIYKDYVGLYRYDARPELTVKVERVGNRLISVSAGQKNAVILGRRLSELRAREFDGRAQFVRSKSGRVTHFIYFEFGKRMGIARKVVK